MERINKRYGCFIIIIIVVYIIMSMDQVMAENLFQDVLDTKHDFTISNEDACQYCHLDDTMGMDPASRISKRRKSNNPLWDTNSALTSFTVYSPLSDNKNSAISCRACHDGMIAQDIHKINKRLISQESVTPKGKQKITDHPTSIPYPRLTDGTFIVDSPLPTKYQYWSVPDLREDGIKIPTGPTSSYIDLANKSEETISFYTVRTLFGKVECDSCHNPHSNRIEPFLRADPEKLCLTCHNK
ncbi:MAG: cytochrome c3 family protein [Nitrospirota bacterium]